MEQRQTDQNTLQTDVQLGSFLSHRTPKVPSHLEWPQQLELTVTTAVSLGGNMTDLTPFSTASATWTVILLTTFSGK